MRLLNKLLMVTAAAGCLLATATAVPSLGFAPVNEQALSGHRALRGDLLTKRTQTYRNSTVINKNYIDKSCLEAIPKATTNELSADVRATVVCKTCYVKFTATAELVIPDASDASSVIISQAQSYANGVENMTAQVVEDIENSVSNLTMATFKTDIKNFPMPTVDLDFDFKISSIPECQVTYTFDQLEVFVQLQTNITGKASYEQTLYKSEVPLDINVGDNLELKVTVFVSLFIDVDGAVNRETGFHVKLADGLAMTVDFFGKSVSNIDFDVTIFGIDIPFYAGVGFSLFADIADFTVRVRNNVDNCAVLAEEIFQYAIGANAGVELEIGGHTWNPPPLKALLPVWETIASQCAPTTLSSITATAAIAAVANGASDSVTSTIRTTFTYLAVGCRSAGLVNCPVSLQSTTVVTAESTSVTVVPLGSDATWPESTATAVTPIAFGTNAKPISLFVSGTPTSFVSTATASSSSVSSGNRGNSGNSSSKADGTSSDHHGLSPENKRVVIGVTVGVGVPLLAGISVWIIFYIRR
ncbi:hypothetical protein CMQ_4714 [Grosmannia clavigera kw1407]|uniref:Mid2 domain-containing protein n=1 Tax=Grosmannia clavigera (strain kw1407 / UAMH 11150) TaxID=655863 RepID=F0XTN4_GROCL|nr:uncharacterized protein CMQ_4714 [Grosmannia clavigera kw1407]EFW98862.1 hypothetical protein CMQ_4714 [Grosmannia clavigera kw1407]